MAKTKRSSSPKRKSKSASSKTPAHIEEAYGIGIVAAGILLGIGVYTTASGIVGEALNDGLQMLVGAGRYLMPPSLVVFGIVYLFRRNTTDFRIVGAGAAAAFLSLIAIFSLQAPAGRIFETAELKEYGGLFGASAGYVARTLFGAVGAYVALIAAFLAGLVVTTRLSIVEGWRRFYAWFNGSQARRDDAKEAKPAPARKKFDPEIVDTMPPAGRTRKLPPVVIDEPTFSSKETIQLKIEVPEPVPGAEYRLPPLNLLKRTTSKGLSGTKDVKESSQVLEKTLGDFEVDGHVTRVIKGPTVTRYEIELAAGVKVNRVVSLADDIALALATADVRILAPIPGRSAIGIEVPNLQRELVTLGDILTSDQAVMEPGIMAFGVGKDIGGAPVIADIADMPHLLIAGATGSGKSVCVNSVLMSLLMRARPDQVKMLLIDPKRVELSLYNDVPHLLTPVVTNPKQAAVVLAWAVSEMEERYEILQKAGVKNIRSYNEAIAGKKKEGELMPYMLLVIDELADLMMVAPNDVEDAICRIAQLARAVGIHLIVATQRPSTDIITGLIKANIICRIAFAVGSQIDSRVILDTPGAEKLIGKGDMLFSTPAHHKPQRVQGGYVSEPEIEMVTEYCKKQAKPEYRPEIIEEARSEFGIDFDDPLFEEAMSIVVNSGQASVSMLQRRLRVGYSRAARLVDMLEARGIVGPHEGSKPRAVLMTLEDLDELRSRAGDDWV
ncbi:MAG: FtsK/SpoIIIE family DNA translocase [Candidatus Aquicultorales bacterium]